MEQKEKTNRKQETQEEKAKTKQDVRESARNQVTLDEDSERKHGL